MGGRSTKFKLKCSIWPFQANVGKHDAKAEVEGHFGHDWTATDSWNSTHSPITEGNTAAPEGRRRTRIKTSLKTSTRKPH